MKLGRVRIVTIQNCASFWIMISISSRPIEKKNTDAVIELIKNYDSIWRAWMWNVPMYVLYIDVSSIQCFKRGKSVSRAIHYWELSRFFWVCKNKARVQAFRINWNYWKLTWMDKELNQLVEGRSGNCASTHSGRKNRPTTKAFPWKAFCRMQKSEK